MEGHQNDGKGGDKPSSGRTVEEMTPQDYLRQLKANYPDLKHSLEIKLFQSLRDIVQTITVEDLIKKKKNALYFKGCSNCSYNVAANVESVKIMIENCDNFKIIVHGPIKTGVIELWRCNNIVLDIDTEVGTLQTDLSVDVIVNYHSKTYLGSIVQAGLHNFKINFVNHPESNFSSGVDVLRLDYADLDDKFDQFITRFVDLIRYADGFHTTEREKNIEDAERERNEQYTTEKLRNMIKVAGPAMGLKEEDLAAKSTQGKADEAKRIELETKSNQRKHAGNKAFALGQFDQALKLYNEALEFTPDNHILHSNRAACYHVLKQFEKALDDADRTIQLNKSFPKGHFRRGLALLELGRKEEALKALIEAHDLAPKDEEIKAVMDKAKQ